MGIGYRHPNEAELARARCFGKNLASKLIAAEHGEKLKLVAPRIIFHLLPLLAPDRLTTGRLFSEVTLIKEACTGCALCAEDCPVDNIAMDLYPVFGDKCLKCYRCTEVCLEDALRVNWSWASAAWIVYPYGWFFKILDKIKSKFKSYSSNSEEDELERLPGKTADR